MKNTGSWASLAKLNDTAPQSAKKQESAKSFELFRKQAQEKEKRVCSKMSQLPLESLRHAMYLRITDFLYIKSMPYFSEL